MICGLLEAMLKIEPHAELRWLHDVFSNSVTIATFQTMSDQLSIESQIVLAHYPLHTIDFQMEAYAQRIPFSYPAREIPDLGRTIERHYPSPEKTGHRMGAPVSRP